MKNFLIILSVFALFASCQQSLVDRAAKEMAEYTRKNCPTPVVNNENVDSATFEPSTRTVHYYYKLHGEIDNAAIIAKHRKEMRAALLNDLRSDTKSKAFKDAGFGFHYTYRSASNPEKILLDENFTPKDYK